MVDVFPEIYTEISKALRAAFPPINPSTNPPKLGVYVLDEEKQPTPAQMPCVVVAEMSNTVYRKSLDSSLAENHSNLLWQIDYYSNISGGGNKAKCKAMAKVVDDVMISHNFVRTFFETLSNDPNLYRMTARYAAVVGEDKMIYRS